MAVELAQEDVCYGEMQVSRGKQVLAFFIFVFAIPCQQLFVSLLLVVSFVYTVKDDQVWLFDTNCLFSSFILV